MQKFVRILLEFGKMWTKFPGRKDLRSQARPLRPLVGLLLAGLLGRREEGLVGLELLLRVRAVQLRLPEGPKG